MYDNIVLGTAQFGMPYGISNKIGKIKTKDIYKILDFLKKEKISALDTANKYQKSEEEIGKYFKKFNKKFNVITKYSVSQNSIEEQLKNTKKYLGYYPNTILAHSYKDYISKRYQKEIIKIKKKYPVKFFGVSLYNTSEFYKILKVKNPDIIQVPCNILDKRFLSKKILEIIKKKSIKIHARSVFLQGLFFLKPSTINKKFDNVQIKLDKVNKIALEEKISISELSLIWLNKKKEIDKLIIGVDSLAQLKKNIKSLRKKISKKNNILIDQINLHDNKIIDPRLW